MSKKRQICKTMKMLYNHGYNSVRDGNISFKAFNTSEFIITPGGVRKNNLSEFDIVTAQLKKDYPYYQFPYYNSAQNVSREVGFHSKILQKEKNDCYVIHCHPKNTVAYMGINVFNNELNNIKIYFPEIQVDIGTNVLDIQAGSEELSSSVSKNIEKVGIVGLKNHGVVSKGETIEDALENIFTLEYYCEIVNKSF